MTYSRCHRCNNYGRTSTCRLCNGESDFAPWEPKNEINLKDFAHNILWCGSSSVSAENVLNVLGHEVGTDIINHQSKLIQEINNLKNEKGNAKNEYPGQDVDLYAFAVDILNCGTSFKATENVLKMLGIDKGTKIVCHQDKILEMRNKNLSRIEQLEKMARKEEEVLYKINYKGNRNYNG